MIINDNQLKGNWGEQYIASKLSSLGCLVRHVPQGHDTGVDLYCEKVENDIPYLHFWCQIKTSNKWKGNRNTISFRPNKNHVNYWLNQPVPVILFIVPDLRQQNDYVPFYIFSEFHDHYRQSLFKIINNEKLRDFLNTYLSYESFLWDLKNGKVSYIKGVKPQYKKLIPKGLALNYERDLQLSLLCTLHILADDFLFDEKTRIDFIEKMIKRLVGDVLKNKAPELKILERNLDPLNKITKNGFVRLTHQEVIEKLNQKFDAKLTLLDDIGAPEESMLSKLYDLPVFVKDWPAEIKAFYMPHFSDGELERVKAVDLICSEGYGEIVGGAEREWQYEKLIEVMKKRGYKLEDYQWYLDLRKYGSVPHAGFGIGLERVVSWICGLSHIREAIPFPRLINRLRP